MLNAFKNESREKGLNLNSKKTEVMAINKKTTRECSIFVDGIELKQQQSFNHLGTVITQDGRSHSEVNSRIAQLKSVFQKDEKSINKQKYAVALRQRAPQCHVELILIRIPWTAKKTNSEVTEEACRIRS